MYGFVRDIASIFKNTERETDKEIKTPFFQSIDQNINYIRVSFNDPQDLTVHEMKIAGLKAAVISIDNMVSKDMLAIGILKPLLTAVMPEDPDQCMQDIRSRILCIDDVSEITCFEDLFTSILSGFAVITLDGSMTMLSVGVQGFRTRGISEPQSDIIQRGSKEGFVEQLRTNITMLRRRIKNPAMQIEFFTVGELSRTEIGICYLSGTAAPEIVESLRNKLNNIRIDTVMTAGYLVSYLEDKKCHSLFSTVGITERPDTVCGKLAEGRIAILVDGVPSALIVPCLFAEYFQTLDDYSNKPYFAVFTRWLKFTAFFIAILLPGIYVSLGTFDPEMFPAVLLDKLSYSIGATPLSLVSETLIILLTYEIMRESGLRMPQPLGYAVSIVGGLVIGDTAVNAGLIGAPTLMVVALSAICSYVIPDLYAPTAILRLLFTIAGGICGIWGVSVLFCVVSVNICSQTSFGIPYTSPLSPSGRGLFRDVIFRADWKIMSSKRAKVQNMPGADIGVDSNE